jgi:hypothetical protein
MTGLALRRSFQQRDYCNSTNSTVRSSRSVLVISESSLAVRSGRRHWAHSRLVDMLL